MYVTAIPNQVIKPAMEVMFWNHPKTLPEPAWTPMNARNAKEAQKKIAMVGRPFFDVREKMRGALPERERPSARLR